MPTGICKVEWGVAMWVEQQELTRQKLCAGTNYETLICTMHQPINIAKFDKVDIPTFSGDPTEFQSFIDMFNASFHICMY